MLVFIHSIRKRHPIASSLSSAFVGKMPPFPGNRIA
jgi:hypothetical protein